MIALQASVLHSCANWFVKGHDGSSNPICLVHGTFGSGKSKPSRYCDTFNKLWPDAGRTGHLLVALIIFISELAKVGGDSAFLFSIPELHVNLMMSVVVKLAGSKGRPYHSGQCDQHCG